MVVAGPDGRGCIRYPEEYYCPVCDYVDTESFYKEQNSEPVNTTIVDGVSRVIYTCDNNHSWLKPLPKPTQQSIPTGSYFRLDQIG